MEEVRLRACTTRRGFVSFSCARTVLLLFLYIWE